MMHHKILTKCASLGALVMAQQALAQTADEAEQSAEPAGLGEIVVTAQKRSENMQKVPIAITAVSADSLSKAGVESTQALAVAVPGLQLVNVGNQLTTRIRGVGSSAAAAGVESPVAIYIDDIYYASTADLILDFGDVERIDVLKGPQGTLFGRNATGGVVQITTRGPTDEFSGSFKTSLDNYLTSRSNLFVAGGLSEDVQGSLSLSYIHQGKGWGKNINTGNDAYKIDHSISVRGKLRAFATERMTMNLSGDFTDREGPQSASFRTFPGRSSILPAPQPERLWDSNHFLDAHNTYNGGGASVRIDQEFDFATLSSITGFRDSKSSYLFAPVPSPTPANRFLVSDHQRQFTQEIQLVSPSSGPLTWAVGAYYIWAKATSTTDITNFLGATPTNTVIPSEQVAKSIAGFAQATYALTPATRVTAGVRYTHEERELFGGPPSNTFQADKPSWRLSVDHEFTPDIMGYASYNRGIKSGGFTNRTPSNPAFTNERLDAYEVGLKTLLMNRTARFNVSGFYYDYQNIQLPIYTGTTTLIVSGPAAELYGVDAEFVAQLTDRLTLSANANWLHARFTEFPNAPFAIPNPGNQGATTVARDAKGNSLPNSPDFTYLIGLDYVIPVSSGDITLSVSDSFSSGFYPEVDNQLEQGSYHLLNASIQWQSPDEQFTLRLYANNILNKAIVSQVASASFGYIADYTNPPRIIGGSVGVKF